MEIADVYVLNKADRDGAKRLSTEIESMLDYRRMSEERRPRVVMTVARDGKGIDDLVAAVADHRAFLETSGRLEERRRQRLRRRIAALVNASIMERMLARSDEVERMVDAVMAGDVTPRRAASQILEELQR
jgi:LAO/AO transport system kinase